MKTNLLILAFVVMSSTMMAQSTVWDPAAFEGSIGLWVNPGNWTNGLPGETVTKTQFKVDGAMDCIVDEDVTANVPNFPKIVQGDGGPGGVIHIKAGGALTTANEWSGIGWTNPAKLIVDEGGAITFGQHMWIAFEDGSGGTEVHINGGTINVNGMFGMDWQGKGNAATLFLNSGLLNLSQIHDAGQSMGANTKIEYAGGLMQIAGDRKELLETVYADKIVGEFEIWVEQSIVGEDTTYMTKLSNNPPTNINSVPVEKVSVSPNPADDYLNVSLANDVIQSVEIIDLSGKVTASFEYGNVNEATIQLQGIAKGVYIVKVKGKGSIGFEKIIIRQ